jgi:hypothetical protein
MREYKEQAYLVFALLEMAMKEAGMKGANIEIRDDGDGVYAMAINQEAQTEHRVTLLDSEGRPLRLPHVMAEILRVM